jgi:hypothetical protein
MYPTIVAEVRNGQIHPLEPASWPEGARVLVTLLASDDQEFWAKASEPSLAAVWANQEDDVYAQLLSE